MQEEIDRKAPQRRYYLKVLEVYRERKIDIIGRNAKQLIFALARRLNMTGISNCEQAWAYAGVCTHPGSGVPPLWASFRPVPRLITSRCGNC